MKTIYVVKAIYEYDGSVDVRAFTTEQAARKLHAVLEDYRVQRPKFEEEPDEARWERYERWAEEAPGSIDCACDYFVIEPLELEGE